MFGKKIYILLVAVVMGVMSVAAADSAEVVMKRAASRINNAGGISASFCIDSGSQRISGTLKALGNKFALQTSASSTWYDGKQMWTYNSNNRETTLMLPTAAEVAEANPLSIVNTYGSSFTASFAKTQVKGCKTIVLTPKSKKLGYKSVHVTIPDSSSLPSKIVIVPTSGQRITVSVTKAETGRSFAASTFVYPAAKYPKVEIVDLR